ncbi:MAG: type II toxin-antitoxin system HicB family antitoxin [Fibrobacteraceae bacterium]|nr:type II toxin-antitoxin system HicB family antitoxin [Fibrobacteraceae bacterium]
MEYIACITKTDDGFEVEFPEIQGCLTCADTLDEALYMASDALNAVLSVKLEDKDPLPARTMKADERKGLYAIAVETNLAVAYSIFEARRGKPASEICRKMEISRQAYANFENPKKGITVASLDKFAKAVGKKLVIDFV